MLNSKELNNETTQIADAAETISDALTEAYSAMEDIDNLCEELADDFDEDDCKELIGRIQAKASASRPR